MPLKSLMLMSVLLASRPSFASEQEAIICNAKTPGTMMIENDEIFVIVNNELIRNSDYWQNFLDGNIKLCTSHVTDMSDLFAKDQYFNQDISRWDTSRVTNMDRMFFGAKRFDQDLIHWDVKRVSRHTDFAKGSGLSEDSLPTFSQ